ncbi:hypothetical protein ACFYT3_31265 [Nocardia amikacinitolerans]|uniref:hypothetical protein n=1 Tax=Nocardia amikacinitolerans TaxID=756689 RepID=UPI0036B460A7
MTETNPSPRRLVSARAPIPVRLADQPKAAGMVVPFLTLAHRDRSGPVWGKLDPARLQSTLLHKLCQICGDPLGERVVVYIRPSDYLRGIAVEPGMHPECGLYSRRVCPMLAGHVHRYNPHPREKFTRCDDAVCGCRYWIPADPDPRDGTREGQPAQAWYEAWLHVNDYVIVSDPGSENTAPVVGIELRPASRIRRLRKVRDAAPGSEDDQPIDVLAAIIATRAIFGAGGQLR